MYHATQQVIFIFVPLKNDFKKYFMFFIHFRHTKDTFFIIIILLIKRKAHIRDLKNCNLPMCHQHILCLSEQKHFTIHRTPLFCNVSFHVSCRCVCGWPEHFSHVRLSSLTMYLFIRHNKIFYISSSRHATNNMGVLVSKFSHLKLALASKTNIDVNVTFYIWTRVLWWGNIIFMRHWISILNYVFKLYLLDMKTYG